MYGRGIILFPKYINLVNWKKKKPKIRWHIIRGIRTSFLVSQLFCLLKSYAKLNVLCLAANKRLLLVYRCSVAPERNATDSVSRQTKKNVYSLVPLHKSRAPRHARACLAYRKREVQKRLTPHLVRRQSYKITFSKLLSLNRANSKSWSKRSSAIVVGKLVCFFSRRTF